MAKNEEKKAKKKNKQRRLTGRTPKPSTDKNVRYSKEQAEGKESRESLRKIRKVLKTEERAQSQRNSVSHSESRASLENSRRSKAMRIACWRLKRRKSEESRKETGKEQMKAEKNGEVDTKDKDDDVAEDNESRRNSRPAPPPSTEREKKSETNSEGKDEKEMEEKGTWRQIKRRVMDEVTEGIVSRVKRGESRSLKELLSEIKTTVATRMKTVESEEKETEPRAEEKITKATVLDEILDSEWYYVLSQVPEQPQGGHEEGNEERAERIAIPAEDHLAILARECPPLWLDTFRRIVEMFGDRPGLAVKVYDGIQRLASQERRRVGEGAPCGICQEFIFGVNLHPHQTELCFLREYEDRYIFVKRCQADRCEVCRKRKQANHVCRFPAEDCRECKKAGIIGRRDHRRHIGKCQVIDALYHRLGREPTETEVAEYVQRDEWQCQNRWNQLEGSRANYFEVQGWIQNGCRPVTRR